jgi:hypothetical protein
LEHGGIHAEVRQDHVVVTWADVSENGTTNTNTFQATLHADGRIVFTYSHVDVKFAVVGIAQGGGMAPFTEVDFSFDLPDTFPVGAIFEDFCGHACKWTGEEVVVFEREKTQGAPGRRLE